MRTSVLVAVLTSLLCAGCFVLDEIDKGSAELERRSPTSSRTKGTPEAPEQDEERPDRAAVSRWWQEARSLVPGEGDRDLVRCRLEGATQFMRSDDCRSRGGQVGG